MTEPKLLNNKNYAPEKLGDVCVLGLGKTGNVAASYLCELISERVSSVHVYAGEKKQFAMRAADRLLKCGATVSFDDKEITHKYDLCITSPGISENDPLIKTAKKNCTEVISELEFAWRESGVDDTWVAITGTNGKTTTTSLISHILNSSGKHAISVGNIGNVALDAVASNMRKSKYEHNDIYVAEVSSYQLALCEKFAPQISVLLNITPDHLDWHDGFENYTAAKLKVYNNASIAVVNVDDKVIKENLDKIKLNDLSELVQNTHDDEYIKVSLRSRQHSIIPIEELKIIGEHNCVNARAAASVCLALGVSDDQIASALASFTSLEHRLESCGIVAGVRLFNDSKATNVDSVLVAIDSFEPKKAIFMLGGHDKNTSLDDLVNKAVNKLKGVICYGEAADRFYDAFKAKANDNFILEKAQNMGAAFKLAMEKSFPGDYVVLSPACSSFDEFDNFEQRGDAFKALVEKCKSNA